MHTHARNLLLLMLLPMLAFGQGLRFETGNWKTVIAKARKQNRLVYVDVYATWCSPCKLLEKNIFPNKAAGDVYNASFVNYRVDAEKGEGIALAKKYSVSSFPTNLFIDPLTEKVIYRIAGTRGGVEGFNKNAAIALAERKDPMTWAKYQSSFAARKNDATFLRDYLIKAERLDKPNEEILNAYLATQDLNNLPDSTLFFIANHTKTLWSQSLPLLYAQRARLAARDTGSEDYNSFDHLVEFTSYLSYQLVSDTKSESKLRELEALLHQYQPAIEANNNAFFYRKKFYEETGNQQRLGETMREEAEAILKTQLSDYAAADAASLKNSEAKIRLDLSMMTLPANANVEKIVADNLERFAKYTSSARAAEVLNGNAWKVYENQKATPAELEKALEWAAKAMELTAPHRYVWPQNADTYASLLYRLGRKAEAIETEEKALKTIQKADPKEAGSYEETLKKMQAGTY